MKNLLTLSVMLSGLILQANATVWRVNNNIGVQADFTSVSAAITAAAAGDTIYIEVSATVYNESITVTKKLIFLGTGYYLSDTANHETQWNTHSATISGIYFNSGSKGSKMSGVDIDGGIQLNDSLITIERCYCNSYIYLAPGVSSYADHDTIRQCSLYGLVSNNAASGSARGLMIYNNLIPGSIQLQSNLANTTIYFINNVFGNYTFSCQNCVFQNNIFFGNNFGAYGTSNYFANNLFAYSSSQSGVPVGNNNQFSVSMSTVFVVAATNYYTPPAGFSHDGQYQLADGSPAIGAGDINGTAVDCGVFGGPAPYVLSGMPNIPSIYSLTVPAQVNDGTPDINISLSAAAH
jgi:hypothetical protein